MAKDMPSTAVRTRELNAHPPTTPPTTTSPSIGPIPVERTQDAPPQGGSLIAAFSRGIRAFRGAPPMPHDDRGRPIQRQERRALVEALSEEGVRAPFPWRRVIQWTVPVIITVWFVASRYASMKTVLPIFFVWPLVTTMAAARARRGDNIPLVLRERMADASLLRAGRCAACAFSLRDIEIQEDGCVVCPECAAAWNRDRWRVAIADAPKLAARGVECAVTKERAANQVDDRGAVLAEPMMWKPKWLRTRQIDRTTPQSSSLDRLLSQGAAASRRKLAWILIPLAIVAVAGTMLLIDAAGGTISVAPEVLVALLGFCAIFALILRYKAQFTVDVRAIALANGACPACGGEIDPHTSRDFDGCVTCAACASAWRFDATGQPMTRHRRRATFDQVPIAGTR